ncbi:MAG: oligosaccharide repeat unit polymerase [Lachnospiraceae bacterium]|nr:oligosaccharide repeat unit polymerase [Lachnospiraceae bacterium]
MYKIYITIIILIILGVIEYKKYKHILAATVIYPVMWVLSLIGIIIIGDEYYELTWALPCVIILGYVMFIIGFRIAYKKDSTGPYGDDKRELTDDDIGNQMTGINLVTAICLGVTVLAVFFLVKEIDFDNILESLSRIKQRIDAGEKPFPYVVVVSRYFLRCAIWYLALVFFRIPKEAGYKTRSGKNFKAEVMVRLIAVSCMAFVVMFTDVSRNDILMTLLPVLFIFLLAKRMGNGKILVFSVLCFVFFFVLFSIFIYFRSGTLDSFDANGMENGKDSFKGYLTGSLPAIDQMYQKGRIEMITLSGESGRYTFSLLGAVSDMLFGTKLKPEVLQDYIEIGPGKIINVFTYYHWLGMDFGLIYAALFQFLYGILYGFLYSRTMKNRFSECLWYCILSYPLLMMFFEDQYLAIAQTWFILAAFIFFITLVCNRAKMKVRV